MDWRLVDMENLMPKNKQGNWRSDIDRAIVLTELSIYKVPTVLINKKRMFCIVGFPSSVRKLRSYAKK